MQHVRLDGLTGQGVDNALGDDVRVVPGLLDRFAELTPPVRDRVLVPVCHALSLPLSKIPPMGGTLSPAWCRRVRRVGSSAVRTTRFGCRWRERLERSR